MTGRIVWFALLALLLVVGGALRVVDLNWDQFQHVHPDERFIVWVADTMSPPSDLATALDPLRSPLNPFRWPAAGEELAGQPRNYAYGHFPLYLLLLISHAGVALADWLASTTLVFPAALQPLHTVGRHLADYNYLGLVGRVISAVADLGTLLVVYWLGANALRLGTHAFNKDRPDINVAGYPATPGEPGSTGSAYDTLEDGAVDSSPWGRSLRAATPIIGLIAASLYAFAVLPIQLSHYATVDSVLTFCVTAAVALAARGAVGGGRGIWLWAGVMCGLAVGSKFSAILLFIPLAVATFYRLPETTLGRQAVIVMRRLALVLVAAVVTFAITNPFALIEWRAYLQQITAQNAMVSGAMDAPYTRQYIGTIPYLYFIGQLSQWGLGWPLGIAAWGGLIWATVEFARQRAGPVLTIMLAWVLPYFATTGLFHAKFLRYMAPLVPCLIAFGAAWAVVGVRWLTERWGRRGRALGRALIGVTLAVTAGWALTFAGIYRQEHPWIAASRWIYEQVPAGAKLLTEHWDDALPLALDELPDRPAQREYVRVELPLWEPDNAVKVGALAAELASGDIIILASNRLSAPIQRLAGRYPVSSQYYRLLSDGGLGYTQVAEFTAYPRLGALVIPDQHADESFTVYDHPRVVVFANTERMSADELAKQLGRYLSEAEVRPDINVRATGQRPVSLAGADSVVRFPRVPGLARYAYQAPAPDATLTLDQSVDTLPVVADFRWNSLASQNGLLAVVVWWFVAGLLGWVAWPLLFPLLRGLADRGYGLSRAFGWLLVGWVHWLGVSIGLWQNRLEVLLVLVLALAVAGRIAWRLQRAEIAAFRQSQARLLGVEEGVYALAFLVFVGVRLLNPDLWQPWNGGEKFMEFAFLNGILRSPTFPPLDPYFAGGIINYYYYGLYLVGVLIKLTGIVPEVAFNLALSSLFALTSLGVFSVAVSMLPGHTLADGRPQVAPTVQPHPTRGRSFVLGRLSVYPFLSVALTLLMGNLQGLNWLVDNVGRMLRGGGWAGYDYWAASRVIPFTINEFPLWTFVFADLHPHLIAMPFGLLVLGLALNGLHSSHLRLSRAQVFFNVVVLSIALGALGAINTWDLPTYALLLAGALLLMGWRRRGALGAVTGVALAGVITGLAVAAYWPFYAHYVPQVGGTAGPILGRFLGWVREPTPLKPWLQVWGAWLFLALSFVLTEMWRGRRRAKAAGDGGRGWLIGLLALLAVLAVLAAIGRPTAALAALPLCLALPLVLRGQRSAGDAFAALLLVMGLAVVTGTELVYLRDFLEGGEWYRMNTLFKFSVPAWLFLGLAAGRLLPPAWAAARRAPFWLRVPWRVTAAVLLAGGCIFLLAGVRDRVDDRFPGARPAIGTLDATAYMTVGQYTWPGPASVIDLYYEREAIQWLLRNVNGTPVIAEAPAGGYSINGEYVQFDYYRAGGLRVASLTGFPTFVGQHQNEQRSGELVAERTVQGQRLFQTMDIAEARRLLVELRVGYVYIGRLERILFSTDALHKFDVMVEGGILEVVYSNRQVVIYRVRDTG